ncbi:MAG: hypothetical protein LBU09_00830, partial [Endomicrobium sp.]|nr:hypothetical protein [Endomicrobium sp.]
YLKILVENAAYNKNPAIAKLRVFIYELTTQIKNILPFETGGLKQEREGTNAILPKNKQKVKSMLWQGESLLKTSWYVAKTEFFDSISNPFKFIRAHYTKGGQIGAVIVASAAYLPLAALGFVLAFNPITLPFTAAYLLLAAIVLGAVLNLSVHTIIDYFYIGRDKKDISYNTVNRLIERGKIDKNKDYKDWTERMMFSISQQFIIKDIGLLYSTVIDSIKATQEAQDKKLFEKLYEYIEKHGKSFQNKPPILLIKGNCNPSGFAIADKAIVISIPTKINIADMSEEMLNELIKYMAEYIVHENTHIDDLINNPNMDRFKQEARAYAAQAEFVKDTGGDKGYIDSLLTFALSFEILHKKNETGELQKALGYGAKPKHELDYLLASNDFFHKMSVRIQIYDKSFHDKRYFVDFYYDKSLLTICNDSEEELAKLSFDMVDEAKFLLEEDKGLTEKQRLMSRIKAELSEKENIEHIFVINENTNNFRSIINNHFNDKVQVVMGLFTSVFLEWNKKDFEEIFRNNYVNKSAAIDTVKIKFEDKEWVNKQIVNIKNDPKIKIFIAPDNTTNAGAPVSLIVCDFNNFSNKDYETPMIWNVIVNGDEFDVFFTQENLSYDTIRQIFQMPQMYEGEKILARCKDSMGNSIKNWTLLKENGEIKIIGEGIHPTIISAGGSDYIAANYAKISFEKIEDDKTALRVDEAKEQEVEKAGVIEQKPQAKSEYADRINALIESNNRWKQRHSKLVY